MANETTTMTFCEGNGTYSVSVPQDGLNMSELIDLVLVPLLRSAGYTPETLNKYIHNAGGWE